MIVFIKFLSIMTFNQATTVLASQNLYLNNFWKAATLIVQISCRAFISKYAVHIYYHNKEQIIR